MELLLAPLRGVTGIVFRQVFTKHFGGFDRALAPFVTTTSGGKVNTKHLRDLLPKHNRALPVVPQLLGNNPDDFARMARKISEMGYSEVNWNLGCPKGTVTKKKRGSGLLPHPELIRSFLEKAIPQLEVSLSIKVRLGLGNPGELMNLIPIFNDFPLSEIIVHPRTGEQEYNGIVDLERFAEVLAACSHKVVYNGDIVNVTFFRQLQEMFPGVDSWMIGRGAVRNPFLPSLILGGTGNIPDNAMVKLKDYHDDLLRGYADIMYGPGPVLGAMKELWAYFVDLFDDTAKPFKRIRKQLTVEGYQDAVAQFFASVSIRTNAAD